MQDAARFFATLDMDASGGIDPDEMKRYERDVAPRELRQRAAGFRPGRFGSADPPSGGGRAGGPPPGRGGPPGGGERGMRPPPEAMGAVARELPQPVAAADADMNRLVTLGEFRIAAARRFSEKDRDGDGRLVASELGPDRSPDRRARRP